MKDHTCELKKNYWNSHRQKRLCNENSHRVKTWKKTKTSSSSISKIIETIYNGCSPLILFQRTMYTNFNFENVACLAKRNVLIEDNSRVKRIHL